MPLDLPNLDTRTFQQLVDDAKRTIGDRNQEWTDHNVSDPGVTLIELFATMVEALIFRLNQVPEKHYLAMLNLLGMSRRPPSPATARVTFLLDRALDQDAREDQATRLIPDRTEVSTAQTTEQEAVSFITEQPFTIKAPRFRTCVTQAPGARSVDRNDELQRAANNVEGGGAKSFYAFGPDPKQGASFNLGYTTDLSRHVLFVKFSLQLPENQTIAAAGVDTSRPPFVWEAWTNTGWVGMELERPEFDRTLALAYPDAEVTLYLPPKMQAYRLDGGPAEELYWVRCRYTTEGGRQGYTEKNPPHIKTIASSTLGATIEAANQYPVEEEIIGSATGRPGAAFRLQRAPVLPFHPDEQLAIRNENAGSDWMPWTKVDHFANSRPSDRHYILDHLSGEVRFGPAIREPNGEMRQYGAVPKGEIRISRYRIHGGRRGNVPFGAINTLPQALPYIRNVTNHWPAAEGQDAESVEGLMVRAPAALTRFRAVTAEDYEYLAIQAPIEEKVGWRLARAHCLPPSDPTRDPTVTVLIIRDIDTPANRPDEQRALRAAAGEKIIPSPDACSLVQGFLDQRRMLVSRVQVRAPSLVPISVEITVELLPQASQDRVRPLIEARLQAYLSPLVGGPEGNGWPLGEPLYAAELHGRLFDIPGVRLVRRIRLMRRTSLSEAAAAENAPGWVAEVTLAPTELTIAAAQSVIFAERAKRSGARQ